MFLASYSIIFTSLGINEQKIINNCKIIDPAKFISELKNTFKYPLLLNSAVVQKCNGSIILIEFSRQPGNFFKNLILRKWSQYANILRDELYDQVTVRNNSEAVQHILESAIGLHSVTPGDSQVYSQIRRSILNTSILNARKSIIRSLYLNLPLLLKESQRVLKIFRGNTSLERIACDKIVSHLPSRNNKIAVIGYGSTGKLVDKILSNEKKYYVDIYNRTSTNPESKRFKAFAVSHKYDLSQYSCVIMCADIQTDISSFFKINFKSSGCSIRFDRKGVFVNLTNLPVVNLNEEIGNSITLIDLYALSQIANKTRDERKNEFQPAKKLAREYARKIIENHCCPAM